MYKEKYLKYKTKYLDLKSQVGGMPITMSGMPFTMSGMNTNKAKEQKTAEELTAEAEVEAVRAAVQKNISRENIKIIESINDYDKDISRKTIEVENIKIPVAEAMAELIKPSYNAIDDLFIKGDPNPEEVRKEMNKLAQNMKDAIRKDKNAQKAAEIAEKGWTTEFGQRVGILWKDLMIAASDKYIQQRLHNRQYRKQWDELEKQYKYLNTYDKLTNPAYANIHRFNEAIQTKKENWDKCVKVYVLYKGAHRDYEDAPIDERDFSNSIKEVILVWNWMKELVFQSWSLGSLIDQALLDVGIPVHPQVIKTWWK